MLAIRYRCPILPVCYGAEAYTPTDHPVSNYLCRRLDAFIAIRQRTADLFREWAGIPRARFHYLPNCVDVRRYGVAAKRPDLVAKYGLAGKTVIATVGRVDSSEKNKGFDEVIETLPLLVSQVPNVMYLVLGDGDDRERLRNKAIALGVEDRVVFAGYIPDDAKADHLRLADVFAMPGSDPVYFDRYPFRFAFLEPLACGVPVVGSTFDCPSERDDPVAQRLVIQVDPDDRHDIKRGILQALERSNRTIDPYITSLFSFEAFERNAHRILDDVFGMRNAEAA
jgi:phosphatidylinositol alpha-1,6-mannosyltransferase